MKQCEECEHPIYRSEVRYELVRGVGKIVCPDCASRPANKSMRSISAAAGASHDLLRLCKVFKTFIHSQEKRR